MCTPTDGFGLRLSLWSADVPLANARDPVWRYCIYGAFHLLYARPQVDLTRVELEEVLPSATIMVVTVTASTTAGQPLSEAGIAAVRLFITVA